MGMSARRSLTALLALLLAFAALVFFGGAVNPGYRHSRDYVSSLASRGANQAWIGIAAFAAFATAHAVVGLRWRRTARVVCVLLLACAALILVVGLARASCPRGAAGCLLPGQPSETDLTDSIHAGSIGIYTLTYVLGAICAGLVLLRRRHRGLGAGTLVLAVLSVLAVGQVDEVSPGAEQRIWLAVNAIGLIALTAAAGAVDSRTPRIPA